MQRLLIYKVDAVCPGHSARLTGDVALKAVIDKSGKVQSLELISGHPMLVPAAIDAAKQWR
jgi:protein TonB